MEEDRNVEEGSSEESNLSTPQPDQPAEPVSDAPPVSGTVTPEQQEQDLEEAQRLHNERTGGGDVQEGEIAEERRVHNERTAGLDPEVSEDN